MLLLKNHPFAVDAHFDYSLLLTYALPKAALQPLIPPCLQLDTFQDKWAFVALALVQTKALRPAGLPHLLGSDFFLIGYRIFVRYTTSEGKRLRGLYILKSQTDSQRMTWLGNVFTHYGYERVDIQATADDEQIQVRSRRAGLAIDAVLCPDDTAPLPLNSPFTTWPEARRFAGPLPFTFSYDATTNNVLIVQGMREHWQPTPVEVNRHETTFFVQMGLAQPILASAFCVRDIPYHWQRGQLDSWRQ